MAQTTQSISPVFVETQHTASLSSYAHSEEPEDNISLMFSACDSLNKLYITLEKLYHVTKMTNIKLRVKKEDAK